MCADSGKRRGRDVCPHGRGPDSTSQLAPGGVSCTANGEGRRTQQISTARVKGAIANGAHDRESIRAALHVHLLNIGFAKATDGYFIDGDLTKQRVRNIHQAHRLDVLRKNREFAEEHKDTLEGHFASGHDIDPSRIDAELVEVKANTLEARLFRFATLSWSIPVSQGFGRRLRFLVRDRQNGRLIGLFAIGDPVFNLTARDNWVGWSHEDRSNRLVHVMDAYVVGAVPPYSYLIGGKLIAALMASTQVKQAYERKYLGRRAVISGKTNRARLVLLTTTSALGRSSLYNRLTIPGKLRFERIGTTKGFGHFHLYGEVFELLRQHLEREGHPYASGHRFGMGPNWKLRVARAALEDLGIQGNQVLKHGIAREVFGVPLAKNWQKILLGKNTRVRSTALPVEEISEYCLNRWIMPRAEWDTRYASFSRTEIAKSILDDQV